MDAFVPRLVSGSGAEEHRPGVARRPPVPPSSEDGNLAPAIRVMSSSVRDTAAIAKGRRLRQIDYSDRMAGEKRGDKAGRWPQALGRGARAWCIGRVERREVHSRAGSDAT